ncbi:uridylate kinase [Methylobacterium durans]|uniref:Uridylate kinase n=1 Tax=Methylobacterium durans TaxID=2202825 RepID=A0A2U8WAY4_9HYPH|nr:uridylate kinase [Methylobacterium durans]AWN42476.1 uridylate kinase [Methylobacterium durans]
MSAPALSVVKLGGSLLGDRARLRAILAGLAQGAEGPCILVPGGGPHADAVRAAQVSEGFDDAHAHRLALAAMGRVSDHLRDLETLIAIIRNPAAAARHARAGGLPVWDPADLASGHPDIPESWSVTSDSLALWLATETGAERCLLLKAAPCPPGAGPEELARLGLVDAAFPDFAARYGGRIVVRGADMHLKVAA